MSFVDKAKNVLNKVDADQVHRVVDKAQERIGNDKVNEKIDDLQNRVGREDQPGGKPGRGDRRDGEDPLDDSRPSR